MKILYSQIKELAPNLKANPREAGEILTYAGFMMDGFTEIKYKDKNDFLISLEVRQNRPDCLSVVGIAKEVAACYGLRAKPPVIGGLPKSADNLDIIVEAPNYVKRILAARLDDLENKESPAWLKDYLAFYGMNSINILVDLSNYVMIFTGYPSHLIDLGRTEGRISWSLNRDFEKITTLDGSEIKLSKDEELIIRDDKNILALAGIVGGKTVEIGMGTKSMIAEFAVYDRSVIRKNSRNLHIVTEASNRLEKNLDPNGSEYAINLLISLIREHCGGKVADKIFEYYPQKQIYPKIEFDPILPGIFAGIEILSDDSKKILENLGFQIENAGDKMIVTPPVSRLDVNLAEDLVEEVIRIYGYNKIPSGEIPKLEVVADITPKNIILADKMRDILSALGFDEVLSWPLVKAGSNKETNYLDWNIVSAQNSVNFLFPDLRQSMAGGLLGQLREYEKMNIEFIDIFEMGKVFGEKGGKYEEYEALGILSCTNGKKLEAFRSSVEKLLRLVGFGNIKYKIAERKPQIANPNSCWDIMLFDKPAGIIYKLKPLESDKNVYFSELDISAITGLLDKAVDASAAELTQKLIILDANVELGADENLDDYLDEIKRKINRENLWSMVVADKFPLKNKIRYTIRVAYKGLSDQEAKNTHLAVFRLK